MRVVVADGKPWISMLLSRNEFTILTHITFLAFQLSINVATFDTTNSLLLTYAQSKLSMANGTCMTS